MSVAPITVPNAAQSDRPTTEAIHKPASEAGGPTKTTAAVTVAKRKGHTSRGLGRFNSIAPTKATTVTNALYGRIKIAEKSTQYDYSPNGASASHPRLRHSGQAAHDPLADVRHSSAMPSPTLLCGAFTLTEPLRSIICDLWEVI